MPKDAGAYKTIGEVAEELGVAQHVLRFWEGHFPQIDPMKRGGGRRYYRPEQIKVIAAIRDLLYRDKYTIKGVQRLLKSRGAVKLQESGAARETPPTEQVASSPASGSHSEILTLAAEIEDCQRALMMLRASVA